MLKKTPRLYYFSFVIFCLFIFLTGCGGGGGSETPVTPTQNPYVQPEPQAAPTTKAQSVDFSLPQNSSLNNETLKVLSFYGTTSVLPKVKRLTSTSPAVTLTDTTGGQVVVISDSQDTPLFFAYLEFTTGTILISGDHVAKGLIWMNPFVMVLPQEQKKELLATAINDNLFGQLTNQIDSVLSSDPKNLLNPDEHPEITKTSFTLVKNAFETMAAKYRFKDIGNEGDPNIKDGNGNTVIFENPKMVTYGVEAVDANGAKNKFLVEGKESLLSVQWGWPPVIVTPSVEVSEDVNDGEYDVTFYKGFNFDVPNWYLPYIPGSSVQISSDATIVGTAFWWNSFGVIGILVDTISGLEINKKIGVGRLAKDVSQLTGLYDFAVALNSGDAIGIFKASIDLLSEKDNWKIFANAIWATFGPDSQDFLHAAKFLVKNIAQVLKGITWANEYLPFLYDLGTAPGKVSYCVTQTSGTLNQCSGSVSLVPPSASLTVSPSYPYIADDVSFDASASTDDRTMNLQYRWDFDGNGSWDSQWTYTSAVTHTYTVAGNYSAKVEVQDGDGLTSIATRYLAVYDRSNATSTAIVIDKSGSMYDQTLSDAKDAAETFVKLLGTADRAAIISFDETVYIDKEFTEDKSLLITAIDSISIGGATALYDAVYQAIELSVKEDPGRRRAVVVLTDGSDNSSYHAKNKKHKDKEVSLRNKIEVIDFSTSNGIPVYTIGLQGYDFTTNSESVLKDIAEQTGGLYFYAPDSGQLKDIYDTIAAIR